EGLRPQGTEGDGSRAAVVAYSFRSVEERRAGDTGPLAEIDRGAPASRTHAHPLGVIRMLVRDEDRVDLVRAAIDRGEAPFEIAPAEPGVDEKACAGRLDQDRVPRAPASEDGDLHSERASCQARRSCAFIDSLISTFRRDIARSATSRNFS